MMDDNVKAAHEAELRQCADSFVYFCENHVKISNRKGGLVLFKLYDYQKRFVEFIENNDFTIGTKFRQGGFTTIQTAWLVWRFIFKPGENNMVLTRTDRIVMDDYHRIAKSIWEELPDYMKPELQKQNMHTWIREANGVKSSLSFFAWQASRGRMIDNLVLDEPAFWDKMDTAWKAIFPMVSEPKRKVIAMSTPNGLDNWFHETYREAEKGKNRFKVFRAMYWEHPEFSKPEWVAETKNNLGALGWEQEILQIFVAPPDKRQREKNTLEFFEEVTEAENYMMHLRANQGDMLKKKKERLERLAQINRNEKWKIEDNQPNGDLFWEDAEPPVYTPVKAKPEFEKVKPDVYTFLPLTNEERISLFVEHASYGKYVDHPCFDKFRIEKTDDVVQLFECLEELVPSERIHSSAEQWKTVAESNRTKIKEREEKWITDDPYWLAMAGIIEADVAKTLPKPLPDPRKTVLKMVTDTGIFPKNMRLHFDEGYLCVNNVPTTIKEDDLRDLYNGTLALKSYEEAVQTAVEVMTNKIGMLFRKQEPCNEIAT